VSGRAEVISTLPLETLITASTFVRESSSARSPPVKSIAKRRD
jgi:hypothetical protein